MRSQTHIDFKYSPQRYHTGSYHSAMLTSTTLVLISTEEVSQDLTSHHSVWKSSFPAHNLHGLFYPYTSVHRFSITAAPHSLTSLSHRWTRYQIWCFKSIESSSKKKKMGISGTGITETLKTDLEGSLKKFLNLCSPWLHVESSHKPNQFRELSIQSCFLAGRAVFRSLAPWRCTYRNKMSNSYVTSSLNTFFNGANARIKYTSGSAEPTNPPNF